MHLTSFVRNRTDVELERLTREGTRWYRLWAWREAGETYERTAACLLCNTFDLRASHSYHEAREEYRLAEEFYIRLAENHGDGPTGALIARLARRELGRRAIEAAYVVLASERTESAELEPVR
jgi:hypothetical protein